MARRSSDSGAKTAEPVTSKLPPELVVDLKRMGEMLAEGDVEGARTWVSELETRWPESDRVRHYARMLAPPTVRVVPGMGRSFARERAWLHEHAREYPGCWIAVLGDRLVAADPDASIVLAAARQTEDPRHTLIHFQPSDDTGCTGASSASRRGL